MFCLDGNTPVFNQALFYIAVNKCMNNNVNINIVYYIRHKSNIFMYVPMVNIHIFSDKRSSVLKPLP